MNSFCWNCFPVIDADDQMCRYCDKRQNPIPCDLRDKPICALKHPLGETRKRAVFVLGEKGATDVTRELADVIKRDRNPYVVREAVIALDTIHGPKALAAIEYAVSHESFHRKNERVEALIAAGGQRARKAKDIAGRKADSQSAERRRI